MKKSLLLISAFLLSTATMSCAKVTPEVTLLLKSKLGALFPATAPQAGRMTLGSQPVPAVSTIYTLQGRVGFTASTKATNGAYALTSKVRF